MEALSKKKKTCDEVRERTCHPLVHNHLQKCEPHLPDETISPPRPHSQCEKLRKSVLNWNNSQECFRLRALWESSGGAFQRADRWGHVKPLQDVSHRDRPVGSVSYFNPTIIPRRNKRKPRWNLSLRPGGCRLLTWRLLASCRFDLSPPRAATLSSAGVPHAPLCR